MSDSVTHIRVSEVVKKFIKNNKKSHQSDDDFLREKFNLPYSLVGARRLERSVKKVTKSGGRGKYFLKEMAIDDAQEFTGKHFGSVEYNRLCYAMSYAEKGNDRKYELTWINEESGNCLVTRIK